MARASWTLGAGLLIGLLSGCSSGADSVSWSTHEQVGNTTLRLRPVSGVTVTSVHYLVLAGDPRSFPVPPTLAEGNLPTTGTSDDVSFALSLPVGRGYFLSLSAESAEPNDDVTCTGGLGPFDITPNGTAPLSLPLQCEDNGNGGLQPSIIQQTDACPDLIIDYVLVNPTTVKVGEPIYLNAAARDIADPSRVIKYAWSLVDPAMSGVGDFNPANADASVFTCRASGNAVPIELVASNSECSKTYSSEITCASP